MDGIMDIYLYLSIIYLYIYISIYLFIYMEMIWMDGYRDRCMDGLIYSDGMDDFIEREMYGWI